MQGQVSQNTERPVNYNLQRLKTHLKASSYGKPRNYLQKCKCCNRFVNKQSLSICFDQKQLFYCGTEVPAWLIQLKFTIIQMLLISLIFSLALLIINYQNNSCMIITSCYSSFLFSFSLFNSFNSTNSIDLMFYLAIPTVIITFVLQLLKNRILSKLRIDYQLTEIFPDSYVVFCQLPFNHLNQSFIINQIDSWWLKQTECNKQFFDSFFQELKSVQPNLDAQNYFSLSDNNQSELIEKRKIKDSKVVQEIIFSYSYPQFINFQEEVGAFTKHYQSQAVVDKEQMNKLIRLHERKKKLLHQTSKNKFCVIIFKSPKYAQYFYYKNNPSLLEKFFVFDKFRYFQIQNERVFVSRDQLPGELYWKNMHLSSKNKIQNQLLAIIVWVIFIFATTGAWYGIAKLHQNIMVNNSSIINNFPLIIALIFNIIILLINSVLMYLTKRQTRTRYKDQALSFVWKSFIININILYLSPFVIYCLLDYRMIWTQHGFMDTQYYLIGIYAARTIIFKYLNIQSLTICCYSVLMNKQQEISQKQANQRVHMLSLNIWEGYTQLLTICAMTYISIPLNPLISAIGLIWSIIYFFTEKINISCLYQQDQSHGISFSRAISRLIQFCPLMFMISCYSGGLLAQAQVNYNFKGGIIISNSILIFVSLIYMFLPTECAVQNTQTQVQYRDIKSKFLALYEDSNEPFLFGFKDRDRSNGYSARIKIYQQMNTMSKTLCQSLKQRLMSNNTPVLNNVYMNQEQQQHQLNNIYFQYQKKIQMKKMQPKIDIPPLFRAKNQLDGKNQNSIGNVNIFSLFSEDDRQGKDKVKKHMKSKIKQVGHQK